MKLVTASQMREIDRTTIEEIGIPSLVLMERAGLAVLKRLREKFGPSSEVVVLAGPGNNGGDGLVVARELHRLGHEVVAFVFGDRDRLSKDCLHQLQVCEKLGVDVRMGRIPRLQHLKGRVVVDALLGTGLNKPVREPLATVIRLVNSVPSPVVAVDIASGVSSDTSEVMGVAVEADITVTFGLPKIGHVFYPGRAYRGELFVEDIGFPEELTCSAEIKTELLDPIQVLQAVPFRDPSGYKGTFGHVLVIGGSVGKTGAALLTAGAALRAGAGLVTIAMPEKALTNVNVLEEMTLPLPSTEEGTVSQDALQRVLEFVHQRADVVAVGPGLGRNRQCIEFVQRLLMAIPVPAVVDADALYALAKLERGPKKFLQNRVSVPVVLTPHSAEMARLVGSAVKEVDRRRIEVATDFAVSTGMYLVLKGAPTVIAEPEGYCFINPSVCSALASAGSGDVLTGIIAGLLAQGATPLEAAKAGVYLHSRAAEIGAEQLTEYCFTATHIIKWLPRAFKELFSSCK